MNAVKIMEIVEMSVPTFQVAINASVPLEASKSELMESRVKVILISLHRRHYLIMSCLAS